MKIQTDLKKLSPRICFLLILTGVMGCSPGIGFHSTNVTKSGASITVRTNGEPMTQGSGNITTEIRPMPTIRHVVSSGFIDVKVSPGESAVVVTTDDNVHPHITAVVENGKLVVSTVGSFRTQSGLTVEVTTPELTGVSTNGSGNVLFSEFAGQKLTVTTSGSGDISFDGCQFGELVAKSSGSGDVTGSGTIRKIETRGTGSGDFDLRNVEAESAVVSTTGSGDVVVSPSTSLNARSSGSGDITYRNVPGLDVRKSTTGSGDVTPE